MVEIRTDRVSGRLTTGHEWDGIEQLNAPIPAWCAWIFYLSLIWSIGYLVIYSSFPFVEGGARDYFDYSSRLELRGELRSRTERFGALDEDLLALDLSDIIEDAALLHYAGRAGDSAFKLRCISCHGGVGVEQRGLDLSDGRWEYGSGSLEDIERVIRYGIGSGHELSIGDEFVMPYLDGRVDDVVIRQLVLYIYFLDKEN